MNKKWMFKSTRKHLHLLRVTAVVVAAAAAGTGRRRRGRRENRRRTGVHNFGARMIDNSIARGPTRGNFFFPIMYLHLFLFSPIDGPDLDERIKRASVFAYRAESATTSTNLQIIVRAIMIITVIHVRNDNDSTAMCFVREIKSNGRLRERINMGRSSRTSQQRYAFAAF